MILLDTTICIAAIRGDRAIASCFIQHGGHLYLPFVVSAELYFGVEKLARQGRDVDAIRRRIDDFHDTLDGVLGVTPETLQQYAVLRATLETAGTPIGPNDLWIAAQVLAESALLVTDNIREFQRVAGLRLSNWLV